LGSAAAGTFDHEPKSVVDLGFARSLEKACEIDSRFPGEVDAGSRPTFSVRTIGRVEIVEAAGRPLSLTTDGGAYPAQVTAFLQRRNANPEMWEVSKGYPDEDIQAVIDYMSRLPAM
jgi:hypothetical protein